jgi:hypothetical protein
LYTYCATKLRWTQSDFAVFAALVLRLRPVFWLRTALRLRPVFAFGGVEALRLRLVFGR